MVPCLVPKSEPAILNSVPSVPSGGKTEEILAWAVAVLASHKAVKQEAVERKCVFIVRVANRSFLFLPQHNAQPSRSLNRQRARVECDCQAAITGLFCLAGEVKKPLLEHPTDARVIVGDINPTQYHRPTYLTPRIAREYERTRRTA